MTTTSTNTNSSQQRLTLIGHLGHDPEERSIAAKHEIKTVYCPVIDGPKEVVIDRDELNFLTFSVACNRPDGDKPRWINCVDWEGKAFRFRRGDKVELYGFFEERTYTAKSGERKTIRQFVVEGATLLRMKVRELE